MVQDRKDETYLSLLGRWDPLGTSQKALKTMLTAIALRWCWSSQQVLLVSASQGPPILLNRYWCHLRWNSRFNLSSCINPHPLRRSLQVPVMEKAAALPQFSHITLPYSSDGVRMSTGSSSIPLSLLSATMVKTRKCIPKSEMNCAPSFLDQQPLDHQKSKRVPENHLLLLYWLCLSLCVDHNKLWKILKEMGIPDHLTCLLRNLYAGQEATVRTGQETTDWFQIGKGVC